MWPVIFVLDGNMHFNMVVDMVRFMNIRVEFCNELPDALIVGIGYPVTGTLTDMLYHVMHLRMRDFVLDREESGEAFMQEHFPIDAPIPSGNGIGFMQFLRQELIPLIESDYRADRADRTLLGHSMGANFALYTLFRHPDLFQRCVAASFDPPLDQEQAFAENNDNLYHSWNVIATADNSSGDGAVKTYPNVHKDFRNWSSGSEPPLSSYPVLSSSFAAAGPNTGIHNIAYDIWLNGVGNGGGSNREVMIWTDNQDQRPAGSVVASGLGFGGQTWTLWATGDNRILSFVPEYGHGRWHCGHPGHARLPDQPWPGAGQLDPRPDLLRGRDVSTNGVGKPPERQAPISTEIVKAQ